MRKNVLVSWLRCLLPAAALLALLAQISAAEEPMKRHVAFGDCLGFYRAACDAVARDEPDNLTAFFLRGLAAELAGDGAAALADFDAVARREPRHFGAQLWRHIVAARLNRAEGDGFQDYLDQAALPPWPKALGELYLGLATPKDVLALAGKQPAAARAEALCAAHFHIGRQAELAGDSAAAMAAYRAALATGTTHVFEYRAAMRALDAAP